MAHYVGKVLHIRPSEILDTWGGAELLVAYGQYMNEAAMENHLSWEAMTRTRTGLPPEPRKYAVRFIGPDELKE